MKQTGAPSQRLAKAGMGKFFLLALVVCVILVIIAVLPFFFRKAPRNLPETRPQAGQTAHSLTTAKAPEPQSAARAVNRAGDSR
jgi:hypothetical protein